MLGLCAGGCAQLGARHEGRLGIRQELSLCRQARAPDDSAPLPPASEQQARPAHPGRYGRARRGGCGHAAGTPAPPQVLLDQRRPRAGQGLGQGQS